MSKLFTWSKKSYIFIILALFYIPLAIGVMYSFQTTPRKGDISYIFNYSNDGWKNMLGNKEIIIAFLNSLLIGISVGLIVTSISLITVYGIWKSKSRIVTNTVKGTSNIPLINPDIITGISLGLVFSLMFGVLQTGDNGAERAIIGQAVMIIPFGITIMYPKSEKFSISIMEASKDLGYGPIKTWFKTYFRYMISMILIVFIVSVAMSFDDFIITKTVSQETTIGRMMYEGSIKPWILGMGTLVLGITLSSSAVYSIIKSIKIKRSVK